jgi:opacity protein-like surface antigen
MRKTVAIAALAAGLAGPVSAATVIDFTADDEVSGTFNGITWTVTSGPGSALNNARHGNNVNCGIYACEGEGTENDEPPFDVGFGIWGGNDNEVDIGESVIVTFSSLVRISGFAGMLAYLGGQTGEAVQLDYWDGSDWALLDVAASTEDGVSAGFDTVGLAQKLGLDRITKKVRFTATGTADDQDVNVTAAALHVAPVPLPASLPLLVAGLGALGFAARRKRKSA